MCKTNERFQFNSLDNSNSQKKYYPQSKHDSRAKSYCGVIKLDKDYKIRKDV